MKRKIILTTKSFLISSRLNELNRIEKIALILEKSLKVTDHYYNQ